MSTPPDPARRSRRPPPLFEPVTIRRTAALSPRLVAVTVDAPALEGWAIEPAASVRLLLPRPDSGDVELPAWTGNEFLLSDGRRPSIRTLTPRRLDTDTGELEVDIVLHGRGAASAWASAARPGATAAVSGPGRGYTIDPDAPQFVLAGDETAIPAISQLLETVPASAAVVVVIEVVDASAPPALPPHPGAAVAWCQPTSGAVPGEALVAAVQRADFGGDARVWAAGEAAAMQRIRRYLFEERRLPRAQATVRGYWKHGRAGDAGDSEGA